MPFLSSRHVARSEFAVVEILIQTLNRRDSIVTRNRVPGECAGQISCKSDLNLSSPLSRDNLHPLLLLPLLFDQGKGTDTAEHLSPFHTKNPFVFRFVIKRSIVWNKNQCRDDVRIFLSSLFIRSGYKRNWEIEEGWGKRIFQIYNFEYNRSLARRSWYSILLSYISVNCVRRSFW